MQSFQLSGFWGFGVLGFWGFGLVFECVGRFDGQNRDVGPERSDETPFDADLAAPGRVAPGAGGKPSP